MEGQWFFVSVYSCDYLCFVMQQCLDDSHFVSDICRQSLLHFTFHYSPQTWVFNSVFNLFCFEQAWAAQNEQLFWCIQLNSEWLNCYVAKGMSCLIPCGLCKHKTNCHVYETNIGGNLYNLMKSLYCNSTCSIKIGENKTQPFSYSRGVRQGCILSPLLFNLYLNNVPHLFENTHLIWPICSSKWEKK